jgi:intron-binding protein aquarius
VSQLLLTNIEYDAIYNFPSLIHEVLMFYLQEKKKTDQFQHETSVFPTERSIFDRYQNPVTLEFIEKFYALPKLNLQFLTYADYILRNFTLFQIEMNHKIHKDINDIIKRV